VEHLVVEAQGQLLHPHRLEIGVDVVERGVEKYGHSRLTARARWRALGAADQARPVVRLEFEGVDRESQAPEGGLGHGQLEDVVEHSPAAVDFPEAIAREVPGGSSPWRKLVAEREVDRLDPLHPYLAVERDRLVFGPQAGVDSQPAAHRPGVLHEQADDGVVDVTERDLAALGIDWVAEHAVVAVTASLAGDRGVPEQVDLVGALSPVDVVGASIELHAGLEHVLPRQAAEIRRVDLRVGARQPVDSADGVRQIGLESPHLLKRGGHVQVADVGPHEDK